MKQQKKFGIYVHIPFCVSKCLYCNFVSKCASQQDIKKYINFLCDEIKAKAGLYKNKIVTSIYFGGGTPSFIDAGHICNIMATINQNFKVNGCAEISIECNPCSFTKEKALVYKNAGINRISFGVQSTSDKLLKTIGRKHTKEMAINAIKIAQNAGFTNISADLMIGIPNQTKKDLLISIQELSNLNVQHISAYMLMLEEGTPLYSKVQNKELKVATDDECVDMYNIAVDKLKRLGYIRYEISNFAQKGRICKHNQNYWEMGEYVGFGVASHSFVNKTRFANADNFEDYFKNVKYFKNEKNNPKTLKKQQNGDNSLQKNYEKLNTAELIEETIMLGLRTKKGVSIADLNNLNYDILNIKKQQLNMLLKNKLIEIKNNYIKLTEKSFGLCSAVVLQLI